MEMQQRIRLPQIKILHLMLQTILLLQQQVVFTICSLVEILQQLEIT